MPYIVGQKGQVTIVKEIRNRLGVKPGWIALQHLVGNRAEIYFLPPEHGQSLKGSLAKHLKTHIPPGEKWKNARAAACNAVIQEVIVEDPNS